MASMKVQVEKQNLSPSPSKNVGHLHRLIIFVQIMLELFVSKSTSCLFNLRGVDAMFNKSIFLSIKKP